MLLINPESRWSRPRQARAESSCLPMPIVRKRLWGSEPSVPRVSDRERRIGLARAVPSYYLKQLAQEFAGDLEGVRTVNNQIDVARPSTNRK